MFLNINCKQFMFRNNPFLIFMVYNFSLKIKSASSNICAKSLNSRWMKMANIGLPKRSGKRLKVREKSVKSQGILKWILSGNPDIHVSYENTFDNSDPDSQQGRAWACASPPPSIKSGLCKFCTFYRCYPKCFSCQVWQKIYIVGEPKSHIVQKHTFFCTRKVYGWNFVYW